MKINNLVCNKQAVFFSRLKKDFILIRFKPNVKLNTVRVLPPEMQQPVPTCLSHVNLQILINDIV